LCFQEAYTNRTKLRNENSAQSQSNKLCETATEKRKDIRAKATTLLLAGAAF
jgi:hypothetical protein